MADVGIEQLSASQQEALQQYMAVTNQEVKDALPLLERSQWNVQVGRAYTRGSLLVPTVPLSINWT